MNRKTDKTDGQTDRQTQRQIDTQTERIEKQTQKQRQKDRENRQTQRLRVATAQGNRKTGNLVLNFPDRENTGNFAVTQGKFWRHRENIF